MEEYSSQILLDWHLFATSLLQYLGDHLTEHLTFATLFFKSSTRWLTKDKLGSIDWGYPCLHPYALALRSHQSAMIAPAVSLITTQKLSSIPVYQ